MDPHQTISLPTLTNKVILAADESSGTMNDRLEKIGVMPDEENRRLWRELIVTTSGLGTYVAGIILYKETLEQKTSAGKLFTDILRNAGISIGIKVDEGLEDRGNGEKVTKGLEGLAARLAGYVEQGAAFAKWRAVYSITDSTPTLPIITENAKRLAAYAKECQTVGLIPIVEPEVLMDGGHSIERCQDISRQVLGEVFDQIAKAGVDPSRMILKPNMVTAGKDAAIESPTVVANATLEAFERVPANMPIVAFLSGGQSETTVNANLAAINLQAEVREDSRRYTGSFGRSLLGTALQEWSGDFRKVENAQRTLLAHAHRASMASLGKTTTEALTSNLTPPPLSL